MSTRLSYIKCILVHPHAQSHLAGRGEIGDLHAKHLEKALHITTLAPAEERSTALPKFKVTHQPRDTADLR